ncbi:hypothetical protein [Sphingomonas sp. 10B4]|uniref:hypothetical protein n=1 Tax=Sphingomonas sp. 10B4 TaxID=3048575 RepID=UPI002B2359D4|nr:hypothetical protein [Sphingomonas sp. 10B4]MEB0284163.1 hypothetical protein [Sphingomonas sp. 10B4]
MKNLLLRASIAACFFLATPAFGQACANHDDNGMCIPAMSSVTPPATSTPLTWSVSTTTTVGPWTPQTGRAIYLTKTSTDTATINVTVTTAGSCAAAVPITLANGTYTAGAFASVSSQLSEFVATEQRTSAQFCVTITPGTNGVTDTGSLSQ